MIPGEQTWAVQSGITNQEQAWYVKPDRSLDAVLQEGIVQTQAYAQQVGAGESHLIIFDRHPETQWDSKIWQKTHEGLPVWGC